MPEAQVIKMERSGIYRKLKRNLIIFLARRLPPCSVIVPLLSEARERPLNLREKITLNLHLFTCEACRRYGAQIEKISLIVKSNVEETSPVAEPSARLSTQARARIRAALKAAAQNEN